jgi:hypothetical protein
MTEQNANVSKTMFSGHYEGGGVWNMVDVPGCRCEHCRSLVAAPGDQGGQAFLIEVRADLFTAYDFNEERVGATAKHVCRNCVRGTGHIDDD